MSRATFSTACAGIAALALGALASCTDVGKLGSWRETPSEMLGPSTGGAPPYPMSTGGWQAPVVEIDASVGMPGDGGADSSAGAPIVREPPLIEGGHVSGPVISANPPASINREDLRAHGYVEEEFLLEGTATAYAAKGELGFDGVWDATPNGAAPYTTRLLVRRPSDASAFNGTVVVEWLNVSGGLDAEVGFLLFWEELVRGGYAYVGVSVQQVGVDALKSGDPTRYAALQHPGDPYAYEIYAQAGAAIGWPGAVDPMRGLRVERLIAYGESQSAMRMVTYANAVHPLTRVYDGLIIHSRAGWGAPVGVESDVLLGDGKPVQVRADLDAKVLQFFTESEVFFSLGPAFAARQPDSDRLRSWEVAGTAHADQRMLGDGTDIGCGLVNDGPQHYVLKAALRAMHRWLKDGVAPPSGAPLEVNTEMTAIARDASGIALGGIRTPAVEAPIAILSGEPAALNAWNPLCMMFGHTIPFTSEQLRALYPTHQHYVDAVTEAARATREAGFILVEEEAAIVAEAMAAPVP